jgi:hypothetical protein
MRMIFRKILLFNTGFFLWIISVLSSGYVYNNNIYQSTSFNPTPENLYFAYPNVCRTYMRKEALLAESGGFFSNQLHYQTYFTRMSVLPPLIRPVLPCHLSDQSCVYTLKLPACSFITLLTSDGIIIDPGNILWQKIQPFVEKQVTAFNADSPFNNASGIYQASCVVRRGQRVNLNNCIVSELE